MMQKLFRKIKTNKDKQVIQPAIHEEIRTIPEQFNILKNGHKTLIDQIKAENLMASSEISVKLHDAMKKFQDSFEELETVYNNSSAVTLQNLNAEVIPGFNHGAQSMVYPSLGQQQPRSLAIYPPEMSKCDPMTGNKIPTLFKELCHLLPMNQHSMSGRCEAETNQMEEFLRREFGFENIPGHHIVDGVRDFQLKKPIYELEATKPIYFPTKTSPSFAMTPQEIIEWQRSYSVYAPQDKTEITEQFLLRALQGRSGNGPDAFLMKFVVRVSTCPILMEFDAKVIHRQLEEKWPHFIKLVSVTGVDFAGRKHDVDDIRTYIRNWQQIFQLDSTNGSPIYPNGRDFLVRHDAPRTELDASRLLEDLKKMAKIRLHACDREKVEIVVETGIGLGVFAGSYIGIDDQVRKLSAKALREILEQDGSLFKTIKAVVFALPIFPSKNDPDGFQTSVYKAFAEEFSKPKYRGPIPVLIIDQDMHRLTVAAAKGGFRVSELNPADSHGVFGEYWQNRGPAVEEKLALTTLGLLVQHHRINPHVFKPEKYHLISDDDLKKQTTAF